MTLYEQCLLIAANAHAGQIDKGGRPYIQHPIAVASAFESEVLQCVALLHDVLEDTTVTTEDLLFVHKLPKTLVEAVVALSRDEDETYKQYLKRVKAVPMARAVKIEDIKHNLRRDRVADPAVRKLLEKGRPQYYAGLAYLDHAEE